MHHTAHLQFLGARRKHRWSKDDEGAWDAEKGRLDACLQGYGCPATHLSNPRIATAYGVHARVFHEIWRCMEVRRTDGEIGLLPHTILDPYAARNGLFLASVIAAAADQLCGGASTMAVEKPCCLGQQRVALRMKKQPPCSGFIEYTILSLKAVSKSILESFSSFQVQGYVLFIGKLVHSSRKESIVFASPPLPFTSEPRTRS